MNISGLGIDEVRILWNTSADQFNDFATLGADEIVEFAQIKALESAASKMLIASDAAAIFEMIRHIKGR